MLLSAVCLTFFMAVCTPVDPVDIDNVTVPEDSRNDTPALAFSQDGTLWLAWSSMQDGRFRLAVSSRKDGEWSPIAYPDGSGGEQMKPVFAFAPHRAPCLVYSVYDRGAWILRKLERGAEGWKTPELLGNGREPTATTVPAGRRLAWVSGPDIVVFSPDGRNIVMKPEGTFTRLSEPVLAGGSDGSVWLAWTASQPGYQSVRVKRLDGTGHPTLIADSGSGVNRNPSLSIDPRGRAWLVYEELEVVEDSSKKRVQGPVYEYERLYTVTKPSQVVLVTTGDRWMKPEASAAAPAFGLVPTIHVSRKGTVWLMSRRNDRFYPLCESLGPEGWVNHGHLWGEDFHYKVPIALAEAPDGRVWGAWPRHFRIRKSYRSTPSWSVLDGPDTIVVSALPECEHSGDPLLSFIKKKPVSPPAPTRFPRYAVEYGGEHLQVFFGDMHVHSEVSTCGPRNGAMDQNLRYTRDVRGLDFYASGDHAEHINDHNWHALRMTLLEHDRPGAFLPFAGFEWTSEFDAGGNLFRGHYNVIYRQIARGNYYFSASDTKYNTPLELWNAAREVAGGPANVLSFAHHTSRRMAWITWNYHDPEMAPLIEIAQTRGSYEYNGCFQGLSFFGDCGRVRGHFVQDGLNRGMRFGLVAGGDHAGHQLAAVFAPELTRDMVFDALRSKRTFATDGERMFLDVRVDGHFMGEAFETDKDERTITITAEGTRTLAQVDLYRNGRVIRSWYPRRNEKLETKHLDVEPLFQRESYYYVRALQEGGGQAWSSPTWVIDPGQPGRFRFDVGGDEIRVVYPGVETDFAMLMHNETEKTVSGTVELVLPEGWSKREGNLSVTCKPGSWNHAVFHVTAPSCPSDRMHLPEVVTRFRCEDGSVFESSLFVVASPHYVSREQKAKLMDARTDISSQEFPRYVETMATRWAPKKK